MPPLMKTPRLAMPRSAMDATRFTATGPYAHSKASIPTSSAKSRSSASASYNASSAPPNETPQQKVARLRAAAKAAKAGQVNTFDRVVDRGRVWADRAHRITAYSLMGISVLCAGVALFAFVDMAIYNRRQRRQYTLSMEQKHLEDVAATRQAVAERTASQEQIVLLQDEAKAEQERAMQEQRETVQDEKKGLFARTKESWYGQFSEDKPVARLETTAKEGTLDEALSGAGGPAIGNQEPGETLGIFQAVEDKRKEEAAPIGGPLDKTAEETKEAVKQTSKSWASWVTGR